MRPGNRLVVERLHECADLLEQQQANPFRVQAYRRAAATISGLDVDVQDLDRAGGIPQLEELPHVGKGIAGAIHEILATGRLSRTERLRGTLEPLDQLRTVPGIGPELARRIHDELHVDTLEQLLQAADQGRLDRLKGLGPRRAAGIRGALHAMLTQPRRAAPEPAAGPGVDVLLDVDRQYREAAIAGALPMIAPRSHNPEHKAWLPILHCDRAPWHFTVLFSNTARAHESGQTHDWVVVYYYDGDHREGQATVVTETHGPLAGQRVVRGREAECRERASG